jgi:hypothetical protein
MNELLTKNDEERGQYSERLPSSNIQFPIKYNYIRDCKTTRIANVFFTI